jgi:hypothetical protein
MKNMQDVQMLNIQFDFAQIWISKINASLVETNRLLPYLQKLPPSIAGAELVRIYIQDMLGFDTPDAKIFEKKSSAYFGSTHVVSKEVKYSMMTLMCCFNVYCVLMCILYGSIKGKEWQYSWIFLCCLTILFLVLIDMSLEAAFIGFIIPSQIIQSVRAVQAALYTSIIGHALPDPRASKFRN